MAEYFCTTGHAFKVTRSGGSYFFVDGLPRQLGGSAGYVVLRGIEPSKSDIVAQQVCLGGDKVLYNMGTALGRVAITGAVIVGDTKQISSSVLQGLESWFDSVRASKSAKPVSVSVGNFGGGSKVYLTAMSLGAPDPVFGLQPFAIEGILAEPKSDV